MAVRRPQHIAAGKLTTVERRKRYDAARSPQHARDYDRTWRKLRAAYLLQHPICECGCGYAAQVVHHKTDHNHDRALLLAWDNLQALTKQCHDRITAARGFGVR